jgi:MFS family permease
MEPVFGVAPSRIFYGWWVAGAFAIIIFLSTGVRFAVGPFLKPMVAELGVDRGTFSLVIALSLFLYGAFMPLIGPLADRWGSRVVCAAGGAIMSGSLLLTSRITGIWEFALSYGVLAALGLAATGHVVAAATITRWFDRRRGTALSLLSVASMTGISLLVPIVMWCILRVGWRGTYVILAVASFLVTVPLSLWILRDSPENMGLHPDGRAPKLVPAGAVRAIERTPTAEALRTPSFWQLGGGLFSCGFSMSLLSAHGIPMLTDHGFPDMTASAAVGFLGMTSIGAGMAIGIVSDRWGRKPMLASLYLLRVVAFSMLYLVRDPAMLMIVAALGGAAMAGSLAMTSALSADIFGRFSVGSIFGLMFLIHQVGAALGSWLTGFLFDMTGTYGLAFGVSCTLLLLGAGLSLTLDEAGRPLHRIAVPVAGGR